MTGLRAAPSTEVIVSAPPLSKQTYIHATAVVIGSAGLLIRGPSRAGKSSLALALLAEAARMSCFGRLIGDDRIGIERQGENLILRGHPAIAGKIEQRGTGILEVPWQASTTAKYVIDLIAPAQKSSIPQAIAATAIRIQGVELPLFTLPWGPSPAERATLIMGIVWKA